MTENNKVFLSGSIETNPVFSHELFGEKFYDCFLKIPRLSNQSDILPLTVSERLLNGSLTIGNKISLVGQFRSYNKFEDGKSKLMLTVFVRNFSEAEPEGNPNQIELSGYICKPPIYRTTPFNREICDLLIAVNRDYNKSDYIPCVAWGRNARFVSSLELGQKIKISGRIQSREYSKKLSDTEQEIRIAYEVSVSLIFREGGGR